MENKPIHCTLTDSELSEKAQYWIDSLVKSGGKSFEMHIPARPNEDPDLIFAELDQRFLAKGFELAKMLASYEKFFKQCWPRLIDREVKDEREIANAWLVHVLRNGLEPLPELKGGMPRLDEPLINDEELKAWEEGEKGEKVTGPVWVKGAPKEAKECFGKVQSVLHDDKHYDAVISPIANTDHWWAVGKDFKFSVHKDKIIEHLDETGNAYQELREQYNDLERNYKLQFDSHVAYKAAYEQLKEKGDKMSALLQEFADGSCDYESTNFAKALHDPECRACRATEALANWNTPAKLTQANADLIREANNRDLGDKPGEGKE